MDTLEKRQTLWFLLALAFPIGLFGHMIEPFGQWKLLYNLACNILLLIPVVRWFMLDARLHAYKIPPPFILCLVICGVFVAPYYFFKTRRWGMWRSLLKSLAFWIVWAIVTIIGTGGATLIEPLLKR